MKISVPFRLACFLCMLVLVLVSATNGQPPSESAKKPSATVGDDSDAEKSADDPQPIDLALVEKTTKAFDAKLDEWKSVLKEMRALKDKFPTADEAGAREIEKQYQQLITEGRGLIPQLRDLGIEAYNAAPEQDFALKNFLIKVAADDLTQDRFESGLRVAELLIEHNSERKEAYSAAGVAAFNLNEFDKAEKYFNSAEEKNALTPIARRVRPQVADYRKWWDREQKLREQEAEADDLPRVSVTTSKGEIVFELFENEAPQTVANFISLVEAEYYDGLSFHRVLMNFMAQGGCNKGDGTGNPGYNIYCECDPQKYPDFRRHFRGTISMAHAGQNTGGSQFFIMFAPRPGLDGKHTAFGRVVKGIEVLADIQRRDPDNRKVALAKPDRIIKAKVLRKRDHQYMPTKVED